MPPDNIPSHRRVNPHSGQIRGDELRRVIKTCVFAAILTFFCSTSVAQTSLCTWNIRDFGQSKDDQEIAFIARTINEYDIVAIQEVVAGPGGPQAVARLADHLSRMGSKWDYVISDPTSSGNMYKKERYAFLWKPSKAQRVGDPWLEKKYHIEIDREPFFMTFRVAGQLVTLCTFHAITKSLNPETEIKYFRFFRQEYRDLNLVFCGDFNLPQSHSVFRPLKEMGFEPAIEDQKTSLRQKCINGDCLASEFDNIFFNNERIREVDASVNHFYRNLSSMGEALKISDHIPVVLRFDVVNGTKGAVDAN